MCCLAEFIIKYALIIGNVIFSLAGLAIAGLGIAVHIQLKDLKEIIPVNLAPFSISIIVLGVIVFLIAYLACCGAIRESMCMLVTYSIFMAVLAGIKIYLTVVIFSFLSDANDTVVGWIESAFNNTSTASTNAFHAMEGLFRCCGTVGPSSYGNQIPISCCDNPVNAQCPANELYTGCNDRVTSWFETFGDAIGGILIVIIAIELLCMIFGFHLTNTIRNNRRRQIN